jgi:hypothetical protein
MTPRRSTGLAWGVAIASLLLWASSAGSVWGQAVPVTNVGDDTISSNQSDATTISQTVTTNGDGSACPGASTAVPPATGLNVPAPAIPSDNAAQEGSFHLCGPDTQVARSVEQLIGGRGFSATLSTRSDGCADLTIKTTSPVSSGRTASTLTISLGSGQRLSIQIVSEGGATRASIG